MKCQRNRDENAKISLENGLCFPSSTNLTKDNLKLIVRQLDG